MAIPEVLQAFRNHLPHIPHRLIDLTAIDPIRFATREDIYEAYLPDIESITEADIERHSSYANQRREDVIATIVKSVVMYAVFSHSWQDGEFLYQDAISGSPPPNHLAISWRKHEKFFQLARSRFKCRFAWADTLCIDKTFSQELSEAHSLLFSWYRNAYVCITYLLHSTRSDLEYDRWFSRSWTLPELLAPKRMKFYGRGWQPLNDQRFENDKADISFLRMLSKASGIPTSDLRSFLPGPNKIRQKLSWASRRSATQLEDEAYSLTALFNTGMPSVYGEGSMALPRLMSYVAPGAGECDVFAWAGPASTMSFFPPSPNGYGEERFDHQLNSDPHHYRLCGDRSFSIVERRLQIKVILIHVTLERTGEAEYTLSGPSHIASISNATLLDRPEFGADDQIAVGIIDYGWSSHPDKGVLSPGERYFCFLLCKLNGSSSGKRVGVEWRKLATEKVVFLQNRDRQEQDLELLCLY